MSARILDGEVIARSIKDVIARRTIKRVHDGHRPPGLAIILVGDDPSSHVYVRLKKKDCEVVGFHTEICLFDESASENVSRALTGTKILTASWSSCRCLLKLTR